MDREWLCDAFMISRETVPLSVRDSCRDGARIAPACKMPTIQGRRIDRARERRMGYVATRLASRSVTALAICCREIESADAS